MRDMMKKLALATVAVSLAAAPARALTVDEAIARHIEARGGSQKWKEVKSLQVSGEMTAWSKKAPFTLERTRDNKYHLDSIQDEKKYEMGYDGQVAWAENAFMGEGARKLQGNDLGVLMRDLDFPNALFTCKEKGYETKLLDKAEFDGAPAIGIELKRPDGKTETWYLDPKTYLEIGRMSPGSDFGREVPLRTYYDDFRVVSGVKIPFHVEHQWYTRERIMSVKDAKVNAPIDEAIFKMPPPPGMGQFVALAGDWKVAVQSKPNPNAPWRDSERTSKIESTLGGNLLQERYTGQQGTEVLRTLSYDRVRKTYRITEMADTASHMDIIEGNFDDQKRLVTTNIKSDTSSAQFGMTIHSRLTISDITPDSFKMLEDYSLDGGKTWVESQKATYTRAAK